MLWHIPWGLRERHHFRDAPRLQLLLEERRGGRAALAHRRGGLRRRHDGRARQALRCACRHCRARVHAAARRRPGPPPAPATRRTPPRSCMTICEALITTYVGTDAVTPPRSSRVLVTLRWQPALLHAVTRRSAGARTAPAVCRPWRRAGLLPAQRTWRTRRYPTHVHF